jgi:hypothetical protein
LDKESDAPPLVNMEAVHQALLLQAILEAPHQTDHARTKIPGRTALFHAWLEQALIPGSDVIDTHVREVAVDHPPHEGDPASYGAPAHNFYYYRTSVFGTDMENLPDRSPPHDNGAPLRSVAGVPWYTYPGDNSLDDDTSNPDQPNLATSWDPISRRLVPVVRMAWRSEMLHAADQVKVPEADVREMRVSVQREVDAQEETEEDSGRGSDGKMRKFDGRDVTQDNSDNNSDENSSDDSDNNDVEMTEVAAGERKRKFDGCDDSSGEDTSDNSDENDSDDDDEPMTTKIHRYEVTTVDKLASGKYETYNGRLCKVRKGCRPRRKCPGQGIVTKQARTRAILLQRAAARALLEEETKEEPVDEKTKPKGHGPRVHRKGHGADGKDGEDGKEVDATS